MAIVWTGASTITGLAADTMPTNVPTNTLFIETDTQLQFLFNGTTWDPLVVTGLNASDITAGTFPVARGGTGLATLTSGDTLLGAGTSNVTFAKPPSLDLGSEITQDTGSIGSNWTALTSDNTHVHVGFTLPTTAAWWTPTFVEWEKVSGSGTVTPVWFCQLFGDTTSTDRFQLMSRGVGTSSTGLQKVSVPQVFMRGGSRVKFGFALTSTSSLVMKDGSAGASNLDTGNTTNVGDFSGNWTSNSREGYIKGYYKPVGEF